MGCMYDWDAELMTCVPEYYKWNKWLFLQLYKKGLAYRKMHRSTGARHATRFWQMSKFNKTELAKDAAPKSSEKILTQWFFKITKYADELSSGLNKIDRPRKNKIYADKLDRKKHGNGSRF
ncbi:MAG: hypothetical protein U5K00_21370 [Melioribacteraceae bacterium]|nr:hypothetical protein [Melioribacteraceae bacterium]